MITIGAIAAHIGITRGGLELEFWLQLHGCPRCKERSLGTPDFVGGTDATTGLPFERYEVTCPSCGFVRAVCATLIGSSRPNDMAWGNLAGPEPSEIIGPHEFARELARCLAVLGDDYQVTPESLAELYRGPLELNTLGVAKTCIVEVAKFVKAGEEEAGERYFVTDEARAYREAHREQFTRAYLDVKDRYIDRIKQEVWVLANQIENANPRQGFQPLPLNPLSPPALDFHERWLVEGNGPKSQRMTGKGVNARGRKFPRRNLSKMKLEIATLDEANFYRSVLTEAELVRVTARETNFVDAVLDGATFTDCDLRSALLGTQRDIPIEGAVFTRCDLRGVDWTGRRLIRTQFIDCTTEGPLPASEG